MQVKVIASTGGSAVIAWAGDNGVERGVIPAELVNGNEVEDALLSLAIPYGLPWEDLLESTLVPITPSMVAGELRKRGIWTYEDLLSKTQEAYGAIMSVYGLDFHVLMREAKKCNELLNR